jgi:hypothetical protein
MQALILIVFSVLTLVNSSVVNRKNAKLERQNEELTEASDRLLLKCGNVVNAEIDHRDVNGVPIRGEQHGAD